MNVATWVQIVHMQNTQYEPKSSRNDYTKHLRYLYTIQITTFRRYIGASNSDTYLSKQSQFKTQDNSTCARYFPFSTSLQLSTSRPLQIQRKRAPKTFRNRWIKKTFELFSIVFLCDNAYIETVKMKIKRDTLRELFVSWFISLTLVYICPQPNDFLNRFLNRWEIMVYYRSFSTPSAEYTLA